MTQNLQSKNTDNKTTKNATKSKCSNKTKSKILTRWQNRQTTNTKYGAKTKRRKRKGDMAKNVEFCTVEFHVNSIWRIKDAQWLPSSLDLFVSFGFHEKMSRK